MKCFVKIPVSIYQIYSDAAEPSGEKTFSERSQTRTCFMSFRSILFVSWLRSGSDATLIVTAFCELSQLKKQLYG